MLYRVHNDSDDSSIYNCEPKKKKRSGYNQRDMIAYQPQFLSLTPGTFRHFSVHDTVEPCDAICAVRTSTHHQFAHFPPTSAPSQYIFGRNYGY